jgi:hypothetical protein
MTIPKLHIVSTEDAANAVTGRIWSPVLNSENQGADYQENGYLEFGDGTDGALPFRVDQAGNITAKSAGILQLQATTGEGGFALQDATPTILTWSVPDDGNLHRVSVYSLMHVTSLETGGVIDIVFEGPFAEAVTHTSQIFAGGLATDTAGQLGSLFEAIVGAGTTVSLIQGSALIGGAAVLYAELWGS